MFKKKMFQVYLLPRDIFAATNLKSGATEVRISESASPEKGTVPKLGDLTTDEYSFVIKCTASRHLPVRRKTPPPCRGGGPQGRRGFPCTKVTFLSFSNAFMLSGDASGGVHVGVSPPPPLRGSSPCEAGQFIPAGFDCRHSEVCKSKNSVSLNSLNSFFQMVLNPQEYNLARKSAGVCTCCPSHA